MAGGQIFSRRSRRGFSPYHLSSFQPTVHGEGSRVRGGYTQRGPSTTRIPVLKPGLSAVLCGEFGFLSDFPTVQGYPAHSDRAKASAKTLISLASGAVAEQFLPHEPLRNNPSGWRPSHRQPVWMLKVRHHDALMKTPPPLSRTRPPDWMTRNWKWFVPLLCLVIVGGIFGFVALVLTLMKSSDAYSGAMARVKSSPAVMASLGSPIKDGFFYTGNISVSGSEGSANFAIPISGPNGTAKFYVSASRSLSQWHYDKLVVKINATKQRLDISDTNQLPDK